MQKTLDPSSPTGFNRGLRDYWTHIWSQYGARRHQTATTEYFDKAEQLRYTGEPEIFSFAQFSRFYGQKVLEVGVGSGIDFTQWVRAGAQAHGVDLTPKAIEATRSRLNAYGLTSAELMIADAEALPYRDDTFDLVYSWGVIHHTQSTEVALKEIVRVCRPGGIAKIMIYNRRSILALFLWVRYALLRARPWRSLAFCLARYMESQGTKAFTTREAARTLQGMPVEQIRIEPIFTCYDRLAGWELPFRVAGAIASFLTGYRLGWFLTIQFKKATR
jgi:ubiquinone/menaquinone biosynthesis C-methylase UbiE